MVGGVAEQGKTGEGAVSGAKTMRIDLKCLWKSHIATPGGVRSPAWKAGESSGLGLLVWESSVEAERYL